jgi:hypothetical protein
MCWGIFVSMKKHSHQRTYTQPAENEKIDALIMPINFGITWQKTPNLSLAAFFRAVSRCFEVGGGCWGSPARAERSGCKKRCWPAGNGITVRCAVSWPTRAASLIELVTPLTSADDLLLPRRANGSLRRKLHFFWT